MMCSGYQSGTYNITIYGSMNQVVNRIGPKLYTQASSDNETQIEAEMMLTAVDQLEWYFTVVVDFESIGVTISKNSTILLSKF